MFTSFVLAFDREVFKFKSTLTHAHQHLLTSFPQAGQRKLLQEGAAPTVFDVWLLKFNLDIRRET